MPKSELSQKNVILLLSLFCMWHTHFIAEHSESKTFQAQNKNDWKRTENWLKKNEKLIENWLKRVENWLKIDWKLTENVEIAQEILAQNKNQALYLLL